MAVDEWDETTTTTTLPDVESDSPRAASFTILSGSATGKSHKLEAGVNVIGRASTATFQIVDHGISRHHVRVRNGADGVFVEDMGSRNGTFVNGVRVEAPTRLEEGDKIQFGKATVIRFGYQDDLDQSFHENLVSSAMRDPLTNLFNKRYLMERLDAEIKFARRHETSLSLLMIDLDHFKTVNDTYGHLAGDAVLVELAAALVRAVRNEDVVARFGGEELIVILRSTSIELAVTLGERLRRIAEAAVVPHKHQELRVTVSVGAAGIPSTPAETVEQLIDAADQALYRAKHAGRNRVSR